MSNREHEVSKGVEQAEQGPPQHDAEFDPDHAMDVDEGVVWFVTRRVAEKVQLLTNKRSMGGTYPLEQRGYWFSAAANQIRNHTDPRPAESYHEALERLRREDRELGGSGELVGATVRYDQIKGYRVINVGDHKIRIDDDEYHFNVHPRTLEVQSPSPRPEPRVVDVWMIYIPNHCIWSATNSQDLAKQHRRSGRPAEHHRVAVGCQPVRELHSRFSILIQWARPVGRSDASWYVFLSGLVKSGPFDHFADAHVAAEKLAREQSPV